MTQQSIYQIEQGNLDRVYLYKEGLFWKAYERSAFHLYYHLRTFKPTKKMVKSVGDFVISIGFPITTLCKYVDKYTIIEEEQAKMILKLSMINELDFSNWKAGVKETIPIKKKGEFKNNMMNDINNDVVHRLYNFNLESRTPLECMAFVAELKNIVNIQMNTANE